MKQGASLAGNLGFCGGLLLAGCGIVTRPAHICMVNDLVVGGPTSRCVRRISLVRLCLGPPAVGFA